MRCRINHWLTIKNKDFMEFNGVNGDISPTIHCSRPEFQVFGEKNTGKKHCGYWGYLHTFCIFCEILGDYFLIAIPSHRCCIEIWLILLVVSRLHCCLFRVVLLIIMMSIEVVLSMSWLNILNWLFFLYQSMIALWGIGYHSWLIHNFSVIPLH